jgi:hypothetical protein
MVRLEKSVYKEDCQGRPQKRIAGIFKQSMGDRNRVGKGLPYLPAGLHSLPEVIHWNLFLGSINV